jgi:hypothetical protein
MTSSMIWSLVAIAMAIVAMILARLARNEARDVEERIAKFSSLISRSCSSETALCSDSNAFVFTEGCGPISGRRTDCAGNAETLSASCLIPGEEAKVSIDFGTVNLDNISHAPN